MNDIVRYDVYSPELDRRKFRYLFPAVFLYVLLYNTPLNLQLIR